MLKIISYIGYIIIAAIILSETLLRFFGFYAESTKELIAYDRTLGWSIIPNISALSTAFEWKVEYHINKDGLRETEKTPTEPGNAAYKILVLGDSYTEGTGIRQNMRFLYLTEVFCNENNMRKVEIINAGVRGYNVVQYYLMFDKLYKRYKPNLVIIAASNGDLDVMQRYQLFGVTVYYRPYYVLQDGKLSLKGTPIPKPDNTICRDDRLEVIKKYLRRHSVFYCFLKIIAYENKFVYKITGLLHLRKKDLSCLRCPQDAASYKKINQKIASAIIKDMFFRIKKDKNNFLIFLLTDDTSVTNAAYYKELSGNLGFFYANFTELSNEYNKNRQKYHFKYDGHFNEKGNKLVAEALSGFLCNKILKAVQ